MTDVRSRRLSLISGDTGRLFYCTGNTTGDFMATAKMRKVADKAPANQHHLVLVGAGAPATEPSHEAGASNRDSPVQGVEMTAQQREAALKAAAIERRRAALVGDGGPTEKPELGRSGVCGSPDAPTSGASGLPHVPAQTVVLAEPVCKAMEDLFLVAGAFDQQIESLFASSFNVDASTLRSVFDRAPELKPKLLGS